MTPDFEIGNNIVVDNNNVNDDDNGEIYADGELEFDDMIAMYNGKIVSDSEYKKE